MAMSKFEAGVTRAAEKQQRQGSRELMTEAEEETMRATSAQQSRSAQLVQPRFLVDVLLLNTHRKRNRERERETEISKYP
ncbi:hypothetical protein RB195_018632 [Necator americanus]|uniref:Uncharacterized protein n=1 Tax=Necator americanus TaxID=51031 RepID=A0ABR1CCX7_NECAM